MFSLDASETGIKHFCYFLISIYSKCHLVSSLGRLHRYIRLFESIEKYKNISFIIGMRNTCFIWLDKNNIYPTSNYLLLITLFYCHSLVVNYKNISKIICRLRVHLAYQTISCLLGNTLVNLEELFSLKQSWAGFGLLVSKFTMPAGNESIISPDSFTWHLKLFLSLTYKK